MAARMPAVYPPGPPPITTISNFSMTRLLFSVEQTSASNLTLLPAQASVESQSKRYSRDCGKLWSELSISAAKKFSFKDYFK
jgi:hypothetical protein